MRRQMLIFASLATLLLAPINAAVFGQTVDPLEMVKLISDPDTQEKLELSDDTKAKIAALIKDRTEATMSTLKDLEGEARDERAKSLRQENDQMIMSLLSVQQRGKIGQLRIIKKGPLALAEQQVQAGLGINDEQKAEIAKLVAQREEAQSDEEKAKIDQSILAVLNEDQKENWAKFTGQEVAAADDTKSEPENEPSEDTSEDTAAADNDTPMPKILSESVLNEDGEINIRFSFRNTPWQVVIEWFAEQNGLSLQMDAPPIGTFNYTDPNFYTPEQSLDVMNGVLLTRGFTLIRRRNFLTVVNLEDEIPDTLVQFVSVDELDDRGEYELVKTLFSLVKMTAEEAQQDFEKLLGPQGKMFTFPAAKQVIIQETAGRLRQIRDIIKAVEEPRQKQEGMIEEFVLEYMPAEDILLVARPLIGLGEDQNRNEDINIAVDPLGTRIFATGKEDKLALLRTIITRVDVDPLDGAEAEPGEQPYLMTHAIQVADPGTAYEVLQTMLEGLPDVRMALDPATNKLIAYARPSEHQTIKATIDELEGEVPQFEVISLQTIDPEMAVAMIANMFDIDSETPDPNGPKVTADIDTMKLFVRATEGELKMIRAMIERLESENSVGAGGNIRILPFSGNSAIDAVNRANRFWTGGNKIQIVTPEDRKASTIDQRTPKSEQTPAQPTPPSTQDDNAPAAPTTGVKAGTNVVKGGVRLMHFVSQNPADDAADVLGSDIIVEITNDGIIIASNDLEALDKFETILRQLMPPAASQTDRRVTVFYLKYAKADVASTLIQQILSGGADSSDLGSLVGDVAGGLLGGGGGLMGMMLGGLGGDSGSDASGGTFTASGTVSIVADPRLNALVVQANEEDLMMIDDLLTVIDQEDSQTDVQLQGKPRLIPIVYTDADNIANVLKEVYADRIIGNNRGQQQQRQPSPEDIIKALRGGGGGGRGGGGNESRGEVTKMTIGVDTTSNSVIVAAPDQLFKEVEDLVKTIDQAGTQTNETLEVRTLHLANPDVVREALSSILGEEVNSSSSGGSSSSSRSSSSGGQSGQATADQIRQRMEFFNRLRSSGAFGSQGGSSGGRPSGFPGSSGGRPGGSPGGAPGGGRPGGGGR